MNLKEAKIILGINQVNISLDQLKKIFKKLMLEWHPDIAVNNGISQQEATFKSQKIILAYEILSENLESLENSSFKYNYETYHNFKSSSSTKYRQYYDYSIDSIDERFINRIIVKSSNVKWIDYIKDLEILIIRFKNCTSFYMYYDVPECVYLKFQSADSPGKFVNQHMGRYKYKSFSNYAQWLNIYKSLSDLTEDVNYDS